MIKGLKIRIYPSKEQELLFVKHIGCCRFIYNFLLDTQKELYNSNKKHLTKYDMANLIAQIKHKKEYEWLCEVSSKSLTITAADLDMAYNSFFKGLSKFPKYKSKKKSKQIFPVRNETIWFDEHQYVHIDKIGKVKYATDLLIPVGYGNKFLDSRISKIGNKWILSVSFDCDNQTEEAKTTSSFSMGIDLGIKETMVVAYDDGRKIVFHNINKSKKIRKLKERIKILSRSIDRKYKANSRPNNKYFKTQNIKRLENKLKNTYMKISNIRENYIHQCTHYLVMMCPSRIVVEDIKIDRLIKQNPHISDALYEQCFYEILRVMSYKCRRMEIEFVKADRYFPSSKTCSKCGHIKRTLKLNERIYVCEECGNVVDRDFNAALNLMSYKD